MEEYNLGGSVPALVYFRYTTPAVYQGDLTDEHAVLEWLIHNRYAVHGHKTVALALCFRHHFICLFPEKKPCLNRAF